MPEMPTMSPVGWVNEPTQQLDYILADFMASEYTQSYVNYRKVRDVHEIFAKYPKPEEMAVELRKGILDILNHTFEDPIVDVYPITDDNNPNVELRIEITVSLSNKYHRISRLAQFQGQKFLKLSNFYNYGT